MDERVNHQHRAYIPLSSEPDAEGQAVAINIRQHRQQARLGSPTAYPANDRRSRSVGSGSSAQPTSRGQLIGNLPPTRNVKLPNLLPNTLLPSQKPVQLRQKDKLVLLPRGSSADVAADEAAGDACFTTPACRSPAPCLEHAAVRLSAFCQAGINNYMLHVLGEK